MAGLWGCGAGRRSGGCARSRPIRGARGTARVGSCPDLPQGASGGSGRARSSHWRRRRTAVYGESHAGVLPEEFVASLLEAAVALAGRRYVDGAMSRMRLDDGAETPTHQRHTPPDRLRPVKTVIHCL